MEEWIETKKKCLKKRGLGVRQTTRMMQDRSEWQGFVRENAWGLARGMNLEDASCGLPQLYEALG